MANALDRVRRAGDGRRARRRHGAASSRVGRVLRFAARACDRHRAGAARRRDPVVRHAPADARQPRRHAPARHLRDHSRDARGRRRRVRPRPSGLAAVPAVPRRPADRRPRHQLPAAQAGDRDHRHRAAADRRAHRAGDGRSRSSSPSSARWSRPDAGAIARFVAQGLELVAIAVPVVLDRPHPAERLRVRDPALPLDRRRRLRVARPARAHPVASRSRACSARSCASASTRRSSSRTPSPPAPAERAQPACACGTACATRSSPR